MSETKWTPGPWGLESETRGADGSDLIVTHADGGMTVAQCRGLSCMIRDEKEAQANARLIAAGPDLYAALKACELIVGMCMDREIAFSPESPWLRGSLAFARAALAKARGES